jgi:hypothetical protein
MWVCLHTDASGALSGILQGEKGEASSDELLQSASSSGAAADASLALHSCLLRALQVQTHVLRYGKPKLQMLAVQVSSVLRDARVVLLLCSLTHALTNFSIYSSI